MFPKVNFYCSCRRGGYRMAFITEDYYINEYGAEPSEENIGALLERASEIVDMLSGGRISRMGGAENIADEYTKSRVMLAAAAEADYLDRNGGLATLDSSAPVQITLGKFSYMNGSGTSERRSFPVSPLAAAHLQNAGIMSRHMDIN